MEKEEQKGEGVSESMRFMLGLRVHAAYQDVTKNSLHSLKETLTHLERVCFNLPT